MAILSVKLLMSVIEQYLKFVFIDFLSTYSIIGISYMQLDNRPVRERKCMVIISRITNGCVMFLY